MTLHPQAAAAVAAWSQTPSPSTGGPELIAQLRSADLVAAAAEPREEVGEVSEVDADGVPGRLYRPAPGLARGRGGIVFAHGGGFVFGDLDTHDAHSRRLANRMGRTVLTVDYRRPPEHAFPAAHDDVRTAARWLGDHAESLGVDAADLVVMGDSAGGSLALVAALREPGLFAACVLVYPFIDPRLRGESLVSEAVNGFDRAEADWYWRIYAGGAARQAELLDDLDFCPLDSPVLGTLPPTQVLIAQHDILRSENEELVRRITDQGAAVEVITYDGMIHGFWRHPTLFDAAEASYGDTLRFLDSVKPS